MVPDNTIRPFENQEIADSIQASIVNASTISCLFIKEEKTILTITHEILQNGYLRITHEGFDTSNQPFVNIEIYHKQMSVLPYASSVGSVAIRPTKEGVIKHKALSAMEEQTNMQLDQIKQQIELLARQAQEIKKRKDKDFRILRILLIRIIETYKTFGKLKHRVGTDRPGASQVRDVRG